MSESRLDFLEGRVEEQSRNWERLFADIGRVDQKIDALGLGLSARIDTSFGQFTAEIARLDQKIDGKIDGLRAELATHFRWTIGVMTALFTAVLAAVLTQ